MLPTSAGGMVALLAVALAAAPAGAGPRRPPSYVILDGGRVQVSWIDGDTFRVLEGGRRGERARIDGFNTLESYGPVHAWGGWRPEELLAVAKASVRSAAEGTWTCRAAGEKDRYGRPLVACPDLARALVGAGLAHVFAVEKEPADPSLLALQARAQRDGAGMWRKGVPEAIVTSLHSIDEPDGNPAAAAYNRICDTRTGVSTRVEHGRKLGECERWCHGGSCMVYVPFDRRYRPPRPACLRFN